MEILMLHIRLLDYRAVGLKSYESSCQISLRAGFKRLANNEFFISVCLVLQARCPDQGEDRRIS